MSGSIIENEVVGDANGPPAKHADEWRSLFMDSVGRLGVAIDQFDSLLSLSK